MSLITDRRFFERNNNDAKVILKREVVKRSSFARNGRNMNLERGGKESVRSNSKDKWSTG